MAAAVKARDPKIGCGFRAHQAFVDRIDAQSFSEGLSRTDWIVKTLATALDKAHGRILPTLHGKPINCDPAAEREVP